MLNQKSLDASQRDHIASLLTGVLANEFTLHKKTKKVYWTFHGDRFATLQQLLKEQLWETEEAINEVARRIREHGGMTEGNMMEFSALTVLKQTRFTTSPRAMIRELIENHESVASDLEKRLSAVPAVDRLTRSFLNWLIRQHENITWILGCYLEQFPVWLHSGFTKKTG